MTSRKLADPRPPEYAKSIFLLLLEDNLISLSLSLHPSLHFSFPSLLFPYFWEKSSSKVCAWTVPVSTYLGSFYWQTSPCILQHYILTDVVLRGHLPSITYDPVILILTISPKSYSQIVLHKIFRAILLVIAKSCLFSFHNQHNDS